MAEPVINKLKFQIFHNSDSNQIPIGLLKSKQNYAPIKNISLVNPRRYSNYRLTQQLRDNDVSIHRNHRTHINTGEILNCYDNGCELNNDFVCNQFNTLTEIQNELFKPSQSYRNRIDYSSIVGMFIGEYGYGTTTYHSESNNIRYTVYGNTGYLSIIHNGIETILICIVFKNIPEVMEYLAYTFFLNLPLSHNFVEVWIDSKFDTKYTQHSGLRSMYRKNIKPGLVNYKVVYKENIINELFSMPKLPKFKTPAEYSSVIEKIGDAYCDEVMGNGALKVKMHDEFDDEEDIEDHHFEEIQNNNNNINQLSQVPDWLAL